ncbi:AEC family transporter [Viridibacterium curvum]|uniref:AEC family transporter n=1 Tax=Viridibacterium curvum TaxID=1101404 RepID=A0ABP9QKY7_9RHOO
MTIFLLLIPDFALILLGSALRRYAGFADAFWEGLERLVYFVLFPSMLFFAVARSHIDFAAMGPLFLAGVLAMAVGLLLGLLAKPWMGLDGLQFASRVQCAFRFNTYIAMAVAGKLHGAAGITMMGVLCGVMAPIANLAAVSLLARHGQGGVLREILRNPLIIATVLGLLCNVAGVTVPVPLAALLTRLSDASIALGLLAVGAALKWGSPGGHSFGLVWLVGVKLMLLPLAAWFFVPWLGLTGLPRDMAVLFAALPTASSAYILAMRMGGDGTGVAWLISATTVLSVFSMTFWLSLL